MATRARHRRLTARPISLREAITDRKLLGLSYLSPRQLELVDLIELYETTIGAAGRQSGKSLIAAAKLVHNITLRPDLDEMARSGSRACLVVANSREQAGITLSYCRSLVESSPLLRAQLVSAQTDRLIFGNGVILAMPCQDRLMRGLTASAIVLDEFAHFVSESDGPRVADRVYAAVRPSLVTFGSLARLVIISTPYGDNLFSRLHTRARNGELPNAAAFTASTGEMNPSVDPAFLERERLLLGPVDYAREFEASFEGGGGQFFSEEEIREVVVKRKEALPEDGRGWVCAIDPSSGGGDPFACVVVGRDARPGYEGRLLVGQVERWQPRGPKGLLSRKSRAEKDLWVDSVLDKVAAIAKRYRASVVSDQHVPGVVRDELQKRGVLGVKIEPWSPTSKSEAFQAVRARIATHRIELPSDEHLLTELRRVRTRYRAGSSSIEIPRAGDSHGDVVMALAAGVLALDRHSAPQPLRVRSPWAVERAMAHKRRAGERQETHPEPPPGVRRVVTPHGVMYLRDEQVA